MWSVDPATSRKRAHPAHPNFGPCLLWPNGWMDEDAAWYGSRPRPRPRCTRRDPSSRERGTAAPPLFSAHVYYGHGRPSQLLLSSCYLICSAIQLFSCKCLFNKLTYLLTTSEFHKDVRHQKTRVHKPSYSLLCVMPSRFHRTLDLRQTGTPTQSDIEP